MKEDSFIQIKNAIVEWRKQIRYTYEKKDVSTSESPILDGEYILKFHNSLKGFYCKKGEEIPIYLSSPLFQTTSLSDKNLSENLNGDKYRLKKLLGEFDDEFYKLVTHKLDECGDLLFTSDPLFF